MKLDIAATGHPADLSRPGWLQVFKDADIAFIEKVTSAGGLGPRTAISQGNDMSCKPAQPCLTDMLASFRHSAKL